MTVAGFALLVQAQRTGTGRWQARCPGPMHARGDRDPSLSICEGRDGRVLLRCRTGCATRDVVAAAGLSWSDLFPAGPPPTPEQARLAGLEHERREAARLRLHELHAEACDRFHAMQDLVSSLGRRLIFMEDSPKVDAITSEYHELLGDMRALDCALLTVEGGPALAAYLDRDLPPAPRATPFELIDFSPFVQGGLNEHSS
jgi:hypothetical protein